MRVAYWVVAPLLLAAVDARAQAPAKVLAFSPSSFRALDPEPMDLQAMKGARPMERPGPWTLYGRLGIVNFQNRPEPDGGGLRFDWRRTGPGLGGRLYVGMQRRF
jgi:hypothetical protein